MHYVFISVSVVSFGMVEGLKKGYVNALGILFIVGKIGVYIILSINVTKYIVKFLILHID